MSALPTTRAITTARPVGVGPELTVDLEAVAANTRLLAARTAGELMAVVKAGGFGHGSLDVARTALSNGATWLGVTSIDEALALRAAGLQAPALSWLNPLDADFGAAISSSVDLAVPSREHLAAIAAVSGAAIAAVNGAAIAALGRARVHLHLDAGMARDGCPPTLWPQLCRAARRAEQQGLVRVVGVMGHLGCADVPDDPANAVGRSRFAWAVEVARSVGLRPPHRHLAATAATLTDPRAHHTLSRIGAGLVGIDPSGTTTLRPAMTLTAPIVSVRRVRAGTPVGYGSTHVTTSTTWLALLPVGYADGLPRSASNRAEILVRGRRCPVVGRISMDQTVVDLGPSPTGPDGPDGQAEPSERVTVFGPGDDGEPTVAEWAGWADTIEHELVTGIGPRVRRSLRPTTLRSLS